MQDRCNGLSECSDNSDEADCYECSSYRPNRCDCNQPGNNTCEGSPCYSDYNQCNGLSECSDNSDEANCYECPSYRPDRCDCNQPGNNTCVGLPCYSDYIHSGRCNGIRECSDNSDEANCTDCPSYRPNRCDCNKPGNNTCQAGYTCESYFGCLPYLYCYSDYDRCDGFNDCSDRSDEANCTTCSTFLLNRCDCYQPENNTCTGRFNCYFDYFDLCDESIVGLCSDGSDKWKCGTECQDDEFSCDCLRKDQITCYRDIGCISKLNLYDGHPDCPDGSDETDIYTRMVCGSCNLTIYRFDNEQECSEIGLPYCDNSTCYHIPSVNCANKNCSKTDVICNSYCHNKTQSCNPYFCADGSLISPNRFCNYKPDCPDGSDEIRTQYGFKCLVNDACNLPQIYLHDDVPQCMNGADLCHQSNNCFECFDKRLIISNAQVCDNIINCYDLSDECLCQNSFKSPVCNDKFTANNSSKLKCVEANKQCDILSGLLVTEAKCGWNDNTSVICETKYRKIIPILCDGRPECRDFSDECVRECGTLPSFCNDTCHSFYPLGDRYCDGIIDPVWMKINDPIRCPEGFDERNCSKRLNCRSGGLISIDVSQVCDGIKNCDDGKDERDCANTNNEDQRAFSTVTEMIASIPLRIVIWIVGLITIAGNTWVIFSNMKILKEDSAQMSDMSKCSYTLMLSLALSDLIMGIYLLAIAIKSLTYSGNYGQFDKEWRSSLTCSFIGSLAVISSETSCFLIALMTAFRLYNVRNLFAARTQSANTWRILIGIVWVCGFLLAFLPLIPFTSSYFTHAVWFSDLTSKSLEWDRSNMIDFACRLATLTNNTITSKGNTWNSVEDFLKDKFAKYEVKGEFGYYGETSVCMPRFYVKHGDYAWQYSLVLITINFVAFFWVMIGYIWLFATATKGSVATSDNRSKQNKKMQKKIASLILTDFVCWMPICIMAYLKFGGVNVSVDAYVVSAIVILPINSAVNPLLSSNLLENILEKCHCFKKPLQDQNNIPMKQMN